MSKQSPLIMTTLPPSPASKTSTRSTASATPALDDKVEYLDNDGIPRRSEKITRRMMQRGHSIKNAMFLSDDDQVHSSLEAMQKENQARKSAIINDLQELEKKQKANAEFKCKNKLERQQWLNESDELVSTRLGLWYDNKYVPESEADITEVNTIESPSKTMAFIDKDGNLRRKPGFGSPGPSSPTKPAEDPAETGAPNASTQSASTTA